MNRSSLSKFSADGYLFLATIAWGITFPLIKQAVQLIPPSLFITLRFGLATLILLPFLLSAVLRADKKTFFFGAVLGAINSAIYLTQATGMETISAAEGAFITGINVVFVPLLLPLFKMGKPKFKDFFCSLICLFGIFILTNAGFSHVSVGVYWILTGSLFVALSIVLLQKFTEATPHLDALAFLQIITTVILVAPWTISTTPVETFRSAMQLGALLSVGFCAIFATSFALLVQTRYQRLTSPARAALIFALEPVFATFFSYFINHELLSWRIFVGGFLILLSILISEIYPKPRKTLL